MRTILLVAAAAATCAVTPVYAATDAECQEMWTKADMNKDGVLSDAEAQRYAAAMRVHDEKTKADGRINQASFLEACNADVYAPRPADAGAPLKGANSFTEGQAKDRALLHGLTDVGALKKDDDGIWRGSASQDGKPVEVAVDFKGNVVPQATR
jgi:putative membrane protein